MFRLKKASETKHTQGWLVPDSDSRAPTFHRVNTYQGVVQRNKKTTLGFRVWGRGFLFFSVLPVFHSFFFLPLEEPRYMLQSRKAPFSEPIKSDGTQNFFRKLQKKDWQKHRACYFLLS